MWRHSSFADSRSGQRSAGAPEPWPAGRMCPPLWNGLPFVSVIAGSLGPTVAIAPCSLRQPDLDLPSASSGQDQILTEDIQ
jgi:hypothetical protein